MSKKKDTAFYQSFEIADVENKWARLKALQLTTFLPLNHIEQALLDGYTDVMCKLDADVQREKEELQ